MMISVSYTFLIIMRPLYRQSRIPVDTGYLHDISVTYAEYAIIAQLSHCYSNQLFQMLVAYS